MGVGPEFPAFVKLEYQRDGSARSTFLAEMDSMLGSAERRFKEFSGEAQRQLNDALSVKRNNAGALDLGVSELEAAAAAQKARAVAAREVANATALAAKEEGDYSQQARLAVKATQALAMEEERAAAEARAHADAAAQVQNVLNRQASATDMVLQSTKRGTEANHMMVNSVRAQRTAFIQLGQQMQDVVIQAQMGTKGLTIFTQQVPQMAFALSGLSDSSNKVFQRIGALGTFLSGPWGAAIFAATAMLGPFILGLSDSKKAADDAAKAHETLAQKLDLQRHSFEEVTKAAAEYNAEQAKARQTTLASAEAVAIEARENLKSALATREKLAAKLEEARLNYTEKSKQGSATSHSGPGFEARMALSAIEAQVSANDASLRLLTETARNATISVADELAKINSDPTYKVRAGFDKLRNDAKATIKDVHALTERLADLNRQEKAATDALRPSRGSSSSNESLGRMTALLRSMGFIVAHTTDGKHTKGSEHYTGNAIDFVPKGGMGQYSKAEVEKMLTDAGVQFSYGTKGVKQFFGPGDKGHSDHFHIGFKGAPDPDKVAQAAERAKQVLEDFGNRSAESIARINAQFDEQPRLIDQAAAATRSLDDIISDLQQKKPVNWQQMIADAEAAKGVIQDALVRPIEQLREDSERRIEIERLITAGQEDQAQALQTIWQLEERIGPLKEAQKQAILDQVQYERQVTDELRRRQQITSYYLDATRSVKQELVSIFSGQGSFANIGKIFQNLWAQHTVEKLFGPMFDDLEKWVKGGGVDKGVDHMANEAMRAGNAAGSLADALGSATARISGVGSVAVSSGDRAFLENLFDNISNDNGSASTEEIVVNGIRQSQRDTVMALTPASFMKQMGKAFADTVGSLGDSIGMKLSAEMQGVLGGALGGLAVGGPVGGLLGALSSVPGLGGSGGLFGKASAGWNEGSMLAPLLQQVYGTKFSSSGSQIGGALASLMGVNPMLGSIAGGNAAGSPLAAIGTAIGFAVGGPAGAAIGSMIGSKPFGMLGDLLGINGIFSKRPRGAAEVSNSSVFAHTNDSALTASTNDWGTQVQKVIQQLAQAVGGSVGNYSIGLGRYKDYYQVSTKAGDPALGNSYFNNKSAYDVYDGTDAQAAMAAAVAAAIKNGAIKGLHEGSQKLLQKYASDLNTAISKIQSYEGVFKSLRQITDPVGAAIEELNAKFTDLKATFAEAGASAEDYAKLEQLYQYQRTEAIKQASEQMTGSLRTLLDQLTIGNDTLSLRDRESAALAKYNPLKARLQAGDMTAANDYADAARALLEIERQLYGSQAQYFAIQDEITNLTRSTLGSQQALIDAATGSSSPFSTSSSGSGSQSVVSAVNSQTEQLVTQLAAVNDNLSAIGNLVAIGGGGEREVPFGWQKAFF